MHRCDLQAQGASSSLQAIVATGVYYSAGCGILLSMDITLTCEKGRETDTHRVDKIIKKVEEGNYAKVLQKVRAVLKKRKEFRAELVDR
jgi:hypothetical protein